ncbi:MAG TPA: hypothetical protein VJ743_15145 [Albitalea sp.]|nr:hypothetical protein [Albitalea sp.]
MPQLLRADRSIDHPTREASDHANVDRRRPSHPKVAQPRDKSSGKPERPSLRG